MAVRDVRGLTDRLHRAGVQVVPYEIVGASPGTHLGIPSPTVTLIVDLDDGLTLTGPGLPGPTSFVCGVGGLHTEAFTIHHDGTQIGVQLNLTPGAVRRLFGVPVGALDSMVETADLDGRLAARLRDGVGSVEYGERADVAAGILGAHLDGRAAAADPDAVRAWQRILGTRGRIRVGDLVAESGWSARRLTGVFTAEFGFGPKRAAQLVRFDAARRALDAGTPPSAVAVTCGYADQAHLSREFSSFTGLPPTRYIAMRRADALVE